MSNAPSAQRLYRLARTRATATTLLLIVSIILAAASMIIAYTEMGLIDQIKSGETISISAASEHDTRALMIDIAFGASYLVTAVVFIMWMYRAMKNLEGLGYNSEYSPKDAVIWWFIPLLWFWRPYQVMREIWKGSHPENRPPNILIA